ncbi:Hypothetical predicted protein, partial [Paramuricea clavata]
CLKKAGRDHRQANCSRRKQCTKVERGNQCTSTHHPLLHKSRTTHVGVASLSEQKDTMLPVITANFCGSNGVHKTGNILFDSRAQINLIRRETADSLRLHDQDITVNIVKVGGEEEEIQTKVYKVIVTGIDDKKKYVVRATGIPCISDEIKSVRSSALAEQFSLPRQEIRRGNGHVDLLVGIDHAHMHTDACEVLEAKSPQLEKTPTRFGVGVKIKNNLMAKIRRVREENSVAEESLTPNELEENRKVVLDRESQYFM